VKFDINFLPSTLHGKPERFDEMFELVQAADELGYNCAWFTEHHFDEYGRPSPIIQAMHAADITKQIKIGTAVVVLPMHHPLHVAEEIATLDHLSHGRAQFGIGRGNQAHEHAGHGIEYHDARARFDEAYEIIMGLWTQDTFAYNGKFWQLPEVRFNPKPFQQPHPPMWQPAVSPETVQLLIKKGLNGMVGPYLMPFPQLNEQYFKPWHQTIAETGRTDLILSHNEVVHCAETDEQAYAEAKESVLWYLRKAAKVWGGYDPLTNQVIDFNEYLVPFLDFLNNVDFDTVFNDLSLIGSPERIIKRLKPFEEAGVQTLALFPCLNEFIPHTSSRKSLELFAKHVMPAFQRETVAV
jgi:alkanesulfonate monooxygenase SsuD/methylene tetrahydromethanopterin reductase-like flavin-dependent oxidoreductase (luciferase family)